MDELVWDTDFGDVRCDALCHLAARHHHDSGEEPAGVSDRFAPSEESVDVVVDLDQEEVG